MIRPYPKIVSKPKSIIGFGVRHTGKEIKDWVWYHQEHITPHTRLAKGLSRVFNMNDDDVFEVTIHPYSDFKLVPAFVKV